VDEDGPSILLFALRCYLCEVEVAGKEASGRGRTIPRIHMTKSAIDGLPVTERDTVYWDQNLPGFGLKVTPLGRKVFIVMYRVGGAGSRLRKYTIGPYGRVTLSMARAQAQKVFAARLDGRDPAEEKKQARRRLVVDQVEDLVETFIRERLSKIRSARTVSNRLRRDVPTGAPRASMTSRSAMSSILSAKSRSATATPGFGCSRR